jgi:hypothetical protein
VRRRLDLSNRAKVLFGIAASPHELAPLGVASVRVMSKSRVRKPKARDLCLSRHSAEKFQTCNALLVFSEVFAR